MVVALVVFHATIRAAMYSSDDAESDQLYSDILLQRLRATASLLVEFAAL